MTDSQLPEAANLVVHLDRDKCQGHGRCYALAPTVYESDDDGYGFVAHEVVGPDRRDLAIRAANNCPEDAITYEEQS